MLWFVTGILLGISLNFLYEWLSDPANRIKLNNFLKIKRK